LKRGGDHYDKAIKNLTLGKKPLENVNRKLAQAERALTLADGLPRRPWVKHQMYAPGFYTGYGVKTIPGVREAIEQKHWKEADQQIVRAANALQDETALIDSAAQELEKGK
jgi:N-acetylated-alpha-linked acidic dipeptidase